MLPLTLPLAADLAGHLGWLVHTLLPGHHGALLLGDIPAVHHRHIAAPCPTALTGDTGLLHRGSRCAQKIGFMESTRALSLSCHSQSHFHHEEKTRHILAAASGSPHPVSALLAGPGLALWPVEGPALPLLHRAALHPAHSLVLRPALQLATRVSEDLTITEKAPTRAFSYFSYLGGYNYFTVGCSRPSRRSRRMP